jgi:hypothetical protein
MDFLYTEHLATSQHCAGIMGLINILGHYRKMTGTLGSHFPEKLPPSLGEIGLQVFKEFLVDHGKKITIPKKFLIDRYHVI